MAEKKAAAPAKPEKAPKDEKNGVVRPGAGSTTGRVWEIAVKLSTKKEAAKRKTVIDACVAEKINPSTAATQYGRWRKYNGLGKG